MVAGRLLVGTLALLCASVQAAAQDSPVPQVPWDLPDGPRIELEGLRAPILKRIEAYDLKVVSFMSRCGRVSSEAQYAACGRENAALDAEQKGIDSAVQQFADRIAEVLKAPCMSDERQLQRDKQALRNQLLNIEQGVRELEELEQATRDARKNALLLAASGVLGSLGEYIEAQSRSASAFKGWLTRYEKQMREKGVPFEALQAKIERVSRAYDLAKRQVAAGGELRALEDLEETWDRLTTIGEAIGTGLAEGQATFREVLSDPTLRPFVLDDATVSEVVRILADITASTNLLKKISPHYALASFLVDGGFEVANYLALRGQIMQRYGGYGLTDKKLEAVEALKQQIQRTVGELQTCRKAHAGQP